MAFGVKNRLALVRIFRGMRLVIGVFSVVIKRHLASGLRHIGLAKAWTDFAMADSDWIIIG